MKKSYVKSLKEYEASFELDSKKIIGALRRNRKAEKNLPRRSKNPVHPGEVLLEDFLIPMKKSQADFASELGWAAARLNQLIKGKESITADNALDLSTALKTSAEVWMNLQVMWDLHQAKKRRKAD
jgi:antitoxin HigA-1